MHDIKFRGQTKLTKEWAYGYLLKLCDKYYITITDYYNTITDNITGDINAIWEENDFVEVYEDSIGQYTGLKDKNGTEIYEGDILPFTMYDLKTEYYYIVFRNGEFEAINKQDTNFIWRNAWKESEVIGNIYDNPELLKGEENG